MNRVFEGHELFMAAMQDQFRKVRRSHQAVVTSFLTLPEQNLLKSMLPSDLNLAFDGGFSQPERSRAIIYEDIPDTSDTVILQASFNPAFKKLAHPDVLGALMHAGMERDQIGDILIEEGMIYLACMPAMAGYICAAVDQIARVKVHFEEGRVPEGLHMERTRVQINTASLRLDGVVAALAHISRAKAMAMIRQGLVKVNDIVLEENRTLCDNDFVSIRRCGRFQFLGTHHTSRKNRLFLEFEKYI